MPASKVVLALEVAFEVLLASEVARASWPAGRLRAPPSRGSILTRQSAVPSHSLTLAHFLPNWIVSSLNDGSSS